MSASNRVETLVQRRQTAAYLAAEPQRIALERPTPAVKTPSGGKAKVPPTKLPDQTFRLVPFKRRVTHTQSNITEGTVTVTSYVLVGRWDADVQRDDEFVVDEGGRLHRYKVEAVEPGRSFRTLADVTYRGVDEN